MISTVPRTGCLRPQALCKPHLKCCLRGPGSLPLSPSLLHLPRQGPAVCTVAVKAALADKSVQGAGGGHVEVACQEAGHLAPRTLGQAVHALQRDAQLGDLQSMRLFVGGVWQSYLLVVPSVSSAYSTT